MNLRSRRLVRAWLALLVTLALSACASLPGRAETQLRVRALETELSEKGYIDPPALDAIVDYYETKVGPRNGAMVVAKAWRDPAFKAALLADATKAVGTVGHVSRVGDHLVAVENTAKRHNMGPRAATRL